MPQRTPNKPKASSFRRKNDNDDAIYDVDENSGQQEEQNPPPLEPAPAISKSDALLFTVKLIKNPHQNTFEIARKSGFLPSAEKIQTNSSFRNELGENIVHIASKNGEHEALANIIKALKQEHLQSLSLKSGQEKNRSLNLFTAFNSNDENTIRKLILENRNIKNSFNEFGETPLHLACEKGFEKLAELLLEKKCNINAVDSLFETPLHKASREGHIETTSLLLKNPNIKIDAKNSSKETALHIACENSFENLAQLLILKNAGLNIRDEENQTPFHIACKVGNFRIAKLLLENGAEVDEIGGKPEQSPLHIAVKNGHHEIAKLLLENGAEVNKLGHSEQTPLHIAVKNGHHEIAKLLLENGADIDAKNKFGFTALHNAVKTSDANVDMVKLLLENGADINFKASNKTALDIVEEKFQISDPNQTFKEIQSMLEERQKIEASVALKALSGDSSTIPAKSSVEASSTLRALSIDHLMQNIHNQGHGVD